VSGRSIAWLAVLLTIVAPPSLVYWSLVGVAEIALTLCAGAVVLLAIDRWQHSGSRRSLLVAAFAAGVGLWVQQYILYYLVALAATAWLGAPRNARSPGRLGVSRGVPAPVAAGARVLMAVAALYALLGGYAFASDGFSGTVFGLSLQVTHPQKMWQISGVLVVIAAGSLWWIRRYGAEGRSFLKSTVQVTGAFLIGFSPFILGRLRGGGVHAPLHSVNALQMWDVARRIVSELTPILFGFRGPGAEPLGIPAAWATVLVVSLALAAIRWRTSEATMFFCLFAVVTVAIFVVSGAFVDAQSFRYLMPLYAALPVLYAFGIHEAWRRNRGLGALLAVALFALSTLQQVRWYGLLQPDTRLARAVECIREQGVNVAWADYWTSYKITFLTDEETIVAPTDADRYPPYTALARSVRSAPTIRLPERADAPCDAVVARRR
jgi:hypothetical protein